MANVKKDLIDTFKNAKVGYEFRFELLQGETVSQLADTLRHGIKHIKAKGSVRQSGRGVHVVFHGYYKASLHFKEWQNGTNC